MSIPPARLRLFAALLLILAILVPYGATMEEPGAPMDEGTLLVYPEQIMHGKLPYRDFESFYAPANIYVLTAVYSVFGNHLTVERMVGLAYRVLVFLAIFAVTVEWGLAVACVGVTIAAVLLLPTLTIAYAWMGAMACGLWALWCAAAPDRPRRTFFGGVLAGAALMFRQDLGPAMIVSTLPLFLLMTPAARKAFVLGGVVALVPLGILTLAAGPREVWNNFFLYPVVLSSPGRRLPIGIAAPYLLRVLALHVAACVVNIVAGALTVRANRPSPSARLLLGAGLFGLGLTHQAMQRIDFVHVPYAAFISLGLLPASLTVLARRSWPQISPRWVATATCALAAALVGGLGYNFARYFVLQTKSQTTAELSGATVVEGNGRKFLERFAGSGYLAGLMVKALTDNARPGQRLFVGPGDLRRTNGNDTYMYHLLPQLVPATYFLEMNPLSANRPNSRLANDVASADWVLLNTMWDGWQEPNASAENKSDAPNEAVRTGFDLVLKRGNWGLWRKKAVPGH